MHRDLVPEAAVMLSDPKLKEKPSVTKYVLVIGAKKVTRFGQFCLKSRISACYGPSLLPGGQHREERVDVSLLVEAPEGVEAAERVIAFLPSASVETLALGGLQKTLLGHSLFPFAPALHGKGLRRERGQQLQRRQSGRRAAAGRGLRERLVVGRGRRGARRDAVQAVGRWHAVSWGGEGWAKGWRGLGLCGVAWVLQRLDIGQRSEVR